MSNGFRSDLRSFLFGTPKDGQEPQVPAPPPPPPDNDPSKPTEANADQAVTDRESEDARLRKKGRAAYIITGDQGAGTPKTATKVLTGE